MITEAQKRANHKYYQAHKERLRAQKKLWRDANLEKVHAQQKRWRDAHPEAIRRYHQTQQGKHAPASIKPARAQKLPAPAPAKEPTPGVASMEKSLAPSIMRRIEALGQFNDRRECLRADGDMDTDGLIALADDMAAYGHGYLKPQARLILSKAGRKVPAEAKEVKRVKDRSEYNRTYRQEHLDELRTKDRLRKRELTELAVLAQA